MSDAFWMAFFACLTAAGSAVLSALNGRKAAEIRRIAEVTHQVTSKVLVLTNSNFAAQLRLTATVTRRLALLTHDPEDDKAADLAERLLAEHEMRQSIVDRQLMDRGEGA